MAVSKDTARATSNSPLEAPQQYTYRPIESTCQVRLMALLPGRKGETLQCSLDTVDIENLESYETISYTWGDSSSAAFVLCEGEEIRISANLEAALKQFRNDMKPRVLWTDRICIDQDNIIERSDQVSLMGTVYSRANRVLIWLGDGDEFTAATFLFLDMIKDRVINALVHPPVATFSSKAAASAFFGIPDFASYEYSCLLKFLERPWFKRAWCYQESVLSQQSILYCGSSTTTGEMMFSLCACLQYLDLQRDYPFISFTATEWTGTLAATFHTLQDSKVTGQKVKFDILRTLTKRRGVGVTDPRDLVYSLLGVASDAEGIEPDYSLSVVDVFTSVVLHIIKSRRDLVILGRVLGQSAGFPTWVPDWRTKAFDWGFSVVSHKYYRATGSSQAFPMSTEVLDQIKLEGLNIDAIDCFMDCPPDQDWRMVLHNLTNSILPHFGSKGNYHYTKEEWTCAVLRTLCADLMKTSDGWRRWCQQAFDDLIMGRLKIRMENQGIDLQRNHRRFFITKHGRIGLTPLHAQKGDLVCLLLGGEVPLLLREAVVGHTFVGECYVHGLMDGEGLVEARKRAHPEWIDKDKSWLRNLQRGDLQFDTEVFTIH